jgi:hypothetical protein
MVSPLLVLLCVTYNNVHCSKKEEVFLFKKHALLNDLYGAYSGLTLRNGGMPEKWGDKEGGEAVSPP